MRDRMTAGRGVAAVGLVGMLSLALWGFWLEPSSLSVHHTDLLPAWPRPRPLRVAVLSDLHVGARLREAGSHRRAARASRTDPRGVECSARNMVCSES
jgi:hypothetical protein